MSELAALVRPVLATALVGFDVDGVLAPTVEHADDARLPPGVLDDLLALSRRTEVAIVSGRALESLDRLFGFPPDLHVIGSHGLEDRDAGPLTLDDDERYTFDQLETLGTKTVEAAGEGAWLEHKPASVVVHTREADPRLAAPAIDALLRLAGMIDGAQIKVGHEVVQLMARPASKGAALLALADRLGRRPIVYLGDDGTDEEAFGLLAADDISVRVGPGDTVADHRLDGPADAAEFLRTLSDR